MRAEPQPKPPALPAAGAPGLMRPVFAGALSLLAPGAGFLYAGALPLAFLIAALFLAASVLLPLAVVDGVFGAAVPVEKLPGLMRGGLFLLVIGNAIGAAAVAALARDKKPRGYQHLWWVLGFGLLVWVSASVLKDRVVSRHIVGFSYTADTSMRPTLDRGAPVLVVRRNMADRLVVGSLVALKKPPATPGGPALIDDARGVLVTRLMATAGTSVAVDDGHPLLAGTRLLEVPCPEGAAWVTSVACALEQLPGAPHPVTSTLGACTLPVATPDAHQVYVLPDDRNASSCIERAGVRGFDAIDGVVIAMPRSR